MLRSKGTRENQTVGRNFSYHWTVLIVGACSLRGTVRAFHLSILRMLQISVAEISSQEHPELTLVKINASIVNQQQFILGFLATCLRLQAILVRMEAY